MVLAEYREDQEMQSQEIMGPRLQFVGKFTLYVLSNGELVVTTGNQRVRVTPDQAAKMLEFMLLFAEQFRVGSIGGIAAFAEGVL